MSIPAMGATKIKIAVAQMIPLFTACQPNAAKKAPAKPPMSVCDDEDGIPYHHVMRFHTIAATKPEKIIGSGLFSVAIKLSFTYFAIVVATLWSLKMKKATKLKNAAQTTA